MTSNSSSSSEFSFLKDGGEMGHLTRIHDWSLTSLGTPDTWPQSLKTILGVLLNSRFPKFLFWGEEMLCFYNDAYRPSLGNDGKHPHLLGQPASKMWPEIWNIIKPMLDQVRSGGRATWSEDQLIPFYRNGQIEDIYWTFSYSPVLDESGKIAGVLTTCTETTDKVVNMRKLAESKDQLHFAIESAELATFDYDPATKRFTGNERLREWFGLPPGEAIELATTLKVVAENDRQLVADAISKTMDFSHGGGYDIEYTIINPRTEVSRIVRAKGRAWFGEDQVAYRFNGVLLDITQQVKAREKLEAEKKRFMILLETMPNIAWTTTAEGQPTFFNQQWYDYTGQEAGHLSGDFWDQATHPEDMPATAQKVRESLTTGNFYSSEYRLRRADGTYRWHLSRAAAVRNEAGEVAYWLGTATDIDEQKLVEARLDEQVRQRTRQLEESVRDLQRSNENLQQFAYVASHDLQEPLRKIQSFGDILKSRFSAQLGEGQDYLSRMQAAASRMSVLIDDLLTYSRIATLRDTSTAVDLNQLLKSVLIDLELTIKETGALVTIPNQLPTVEGDASQLRQLFQNLLSNALKFQLPDATPTLSISSRKIAEADLPATVRPTRFAAHYHCISVADNGIGFEEKYLDRIFEVFQRLHGKSAYSGTGIGLAICRKVATSNGGAITAQSQLGEGATFSLYLPV